MKREELARYLDQTLEIARFKDYCPNGLQVEGRAEIRHIVTGVTATQALIEAAIARGADTLLVHHGWFWKGEDGRIAGIRRRRIGALLQHDINLLAYHLPLDAHAEFGNNAQLAQRLGWRIEGRFADQDIGFFGAPDGEAPPATDIAARIEAACSRTPLLIGDGERRVHRVAWCSGGAQGYFEQAIALGADLFVSGEISEQTVHLARESGVPYIAAGHHATERYGAEALGRHLAQKFALRCDFIDIDNPV
jgi:dinuclear metal center YbgI/SA1388 family protein